MSDGRAVDFEDALHRMAPLERVGPLRLRYEPSLLIGEPAERRPMSRAALAVRVLSLLFGIGAVYCVLSSAAGAFPLTALTLAAATAVSFAASAWLDRRIFARRFVLNFGTETLRIDDLPTPLRRPRTRTVRFDDIAAADVVEVRGGFAIHVTLKGGLSGASVEPLTDAIPPEDVETLRRLWRVLRDAFGLSRPSPELR